MKTVESPDNTQVSDQPDELTYDDQAIYNLTDSDGNLNISEISAEEVKTRHRLGEL